MSFLKRFYVSLGEHWWSKLLGVHPGRITSDLLARFLMSKRHFNAATGAINSSGFMPPADLRLSVFQIKGLTSVEVWELGLRYVAQPPDRNVHGRADLANGSVRDVGLTLELDDSPPRHAAIKGWPTEKSEQKLRALELAKRSTLSVAPRA